MKLKKYFGLTPIFILPIAISATVFTIWKEQGISNSPSTQINEELLTGNREQRLSAMGNFNPYQDLPPISGERKKITNKYASNLQSSPLPVSRSLFPLSQGVEIPTMTWQNTRLPDWHQLTFAKMPAITESSSFQAPPGVSEKLGYNPSRSWNIGQTPDTFMMLGDFQDSFQLQQFSLTDISQITGLDFNQVNLASFGVVKFQTLNNLVNAIPDLKDIPVDKVQPIFDLLSQELSTSFNANQSLNELLQESPHLGDLSLASLNLESYNIDSIPGLLITPIGTFEKWQGVYINEIPGLTNVPFSQFPNPINPVGAEVGIVDIAFGTDEQQRNRTISGSNKQGFTVPCKKDCAHIELSGSASVLGKAWISGKYQLVDGGKGILGSVNGGKEPTGRHPFGDAFKVAIWNVSEVDGMMSQALFFRVCMRNKFVDLGCTPYFIGPVPFMTYGENESIFLGVVD